MVFVPPFQFGIPATNVYTRSTWTDAWTLQTDVYANSLSYSAGGAFGRATLVYDYGLIRRQSENQFNTFLPLSLEGSYVKIEYDSVETGASTQTWYGIIVRTQEEKLPTAVLAKAKTGTQTFDAVTLDWMLWRKQIHQSVIAPAAAVINRAITFNAKQGSYRTGDEKPRPNMDSMTQIQNGIVHHLFAEDLQDAEHWSIGDQINYLLANFQPHDGNGPIFRLAANADTDYLSWHFPTTPTHGRTLYDIINANIDRKRGLAWSLTIDDVADEVLIVVHSFAQAQLTLPSTHTIEPNASQITIDTTDNKYVVRSIVTRDRQRRYSQVRCEGAARGACFTMGIGDGSMVEDWTTDHESTYVTGDTSATGDPDTVRSLHDSFRRQDNHKHVYQRFRLTSDWDDLVGDGIDPNLRNEFACPSLDPNANVLAEEEKAWIPGIRFLNWLPLKEFHEYDVFSVEAPVDNTPPGTVAGFLRPFATGEHNGKRFLMHSLSAFAESEQSPEGGVTFSSVVRAADDGPAIYIAPNKVAHVQALNHFSNSPVTSDIVPSIDFSTFTATVFAEWDSPIHASHPDVPQAAVGDLQDLLVIRIGNRARLDWIAENTVLGVSNGAVVHAPDSGFLRDDRDLLRNLARTAWEWYSTERRAIELSLAFVTSEFSIGQLVTSYDSETVNSLITGIHVDFSRGMTRIVSDYANLDFQNLI